MATLPQGQPVPVKPFGFASDQHGMPGGRQACAGSDPAIITTVVVTAAIAAMKAMKAA